MFPRLRRIWLSLGAVFVVTLASASCSVLLKEDAQQCKADSDCTGLGFTGASCNVSAGVCIATLGTAGANNAGSAGALGQAGASAGGSPSAGGGGVGGGAQSSAGAAGRPLADGGEAGLGEAGAAPVCAGDCLDPVTIRLVESAPLPAYQPPGTLLGVEQFHTDVCPQDQVLTGFNLTFGSDASANKFLLDAQAQCSVPSLSVTTPLELVLDAGMTLPKRGTETNLINTALVQCLPGQIVVGWSGIEDSAHISKFVLRCAAVTIATTKAGVSSLSVGAASEVVPFAGYDSTATALAPQDCPEGFVARGANIRLSDAMVTTLPQRIERFGLVCGRPSLVFQTGAACKTDGDCDSGSCIGNYCGPPTCEPAVGSDCKCERLDTRDYQICTDAVTFTQAAGTGGCGAAKMRLVKIDDGIENGWLFSTGLVYLPAGLNNSALWLGATDGSQEGKWVWLDAKQTQFWQGMNVDQGGVAIGGLYSAWKRIPESEEPNNGHGAPNPAENCGFIDINGPTADDRWVDGKCADTRPYACEFEDGR
jgi:hypothetical protein